MQIRVVDLFTFSLGGNWNKQGAVTLMCAIYQCFDVD